LKAKTGITIARLLKVINLQPTKYYQWKKRFGIPNHHNGKIPRDFWLEPWEIEAILEYKQLHPYEGYKRLTYMMMDNNIVAVSPSTTYRILRKAGLTSQWKNNTLETKKKGFTQPTEPHQQWHMDISYVNFRGTYLFLISVLDGYSRFIAHHDLRTHMQEYDVELVLQKALEKYPNASSEIISDNGSQFISRDFKIFLKDAGLKHIRTSVNHPQSNGKLEAFHKNIKTECIRRESFLNLEEARAKVAKYVYQYNHYRLHSGINYVAPHDMLTGRAEEIFKERDRKLQEARDRRKRNYHSKRAIFDAA
jgi:transposase InsO family protein